MGAILIQRRAKPDNGEISGLQLPDIAIQTFGLTGVFGNAPAVSDISAAHLPQHSLLPGLEFCNGLANNVHAVDDAAQGDSNRPGSGEQQSNSKGFTMCAQCQKIGDEVIGYRELPFPVWWLMCALPLPVYAWITDSASLSEQGNLFVMLLVTLFFSFMMTAPIAAVLSGLMYGPWRDAAIRWGERISKKIVFRSLRS